MSAQLDKLAMDLAAQKIRLSRAAASCTIAEANFNDAEAELKRLNKAFDDEVERIRSAPLVIIK